MADPRRLWSEQWRTVRRWILDRDLNLCQIKGPTCTRYATQVDHIVARADGGDVLDPANLRAACAQCNGAAGARRTNQLRYSKTVAAYETRL